MLCSAHGHYGGGVCHCEEGWKGSECDIPVSECEMPTCSNHGRCIEGDCHCERGWKGLFCEQRKSNLYINDMKQGLKSSEIKIFADDTVLFVSHKDIKQAQIL